MPRSCPSLVGTNSLQAFCKLFGVGDPNGLLPAKCRAVLGIAGDRFTISTNRLKVKVAHWTLDGVNSFLCLEGLPPSRGSGSLQRTTAYDLGLGLDTLQEDYQEFNESILTILPKKSEEVDEMGIPYILFGEYSPR